MNEGGVLAGCKKFVPLTDLPDAHLSNNLLASVTQTSSSLISANLFNGNCFPFWMSVQLPIALPVAKTNICGAKYNLMEGWASLSENSKSGVLQTSSGAL